MVITCWLACLSILIYYYLVLLFNMIPVILVLCILLVVGFEFKCMLVIIDLKLIVFVV